MALEPDVMFMPTKTQRPAALRAGLYAQSCRWLTRSANGPAAPRTSWSQRAGGGCDAGENRQGEKGRKDRLHAQVRVLNAKLWLAFPRR